MRRGKTVLQIFIVWSTYCKSPPHGTLTGANRPPLHAQGALSCAGRAELTRDQLDAVVAASAEAYPFPTNLDTDPPIGGLASESQAELVKRALSEGMTHEAFNAALDQNFSKRLP